MKKNLFILSFIMLLLASALAMAYMNVTLVSPANGTTTSDNTPIFGFNPITDNASSIYCQLNVVGTTQPYMTSVNNTNNSLTAYALPVGTYIWNVNCTSGTEKNISFTNRTITYALYESADVAPAIIDSLTKVIVMIASLAGIIGIVLVFAFAKKKGAGKLLK